MTAGPGARIVIAGDDSTLPLVRRELEAAGFDVAAAVGNGPAAVQAVLKHHAELIVINIHLAGGSIDTAATIATRSPSTAIVMLTASEADHEFFSALRAGASGYLGMGADSTSRLPEVVRRVLAGEAVFPGRLAATLVAEFRMLERYRMLRSNSPGNDPLTPRELEVLELLANGLTTSQIAARLYIGEVTVRTHVSAAVHKLRVPSRKAAIELFRRGGFATSTGT